MKNVLFVVDERCMGGVSTLLTDMLFMMDLSNLNVDVLVLHDNGDMLNNLPRNVNVIYGTPYFEAIDIPIKSILKTKNIKLLFKKFITVFDMKTGLVKKKIIRERKKMKLKHYDYEIAFKDGYTAIFTAFGDSDIKYHWIQYDYKTDNPNKKYPKLFNKILPQFDKIISVCENIKEDFNNIYHLGDKVEVIDNLVNVKKIKRNAMEECPTVLDPECINIICVGRILNSTKGYDRLLRVFKRLDDDNLIENCVLRIYGDGPDFESNRNYILENNLGKKVIMCGRVNNPYMYYKNNDLFILPSYFESFGLVIVEAMTLGVPVLATENSATAKLIDNGVNGMIVENSEEGLYFGIRDLILNKNKLAEFKSNLEGYTYHNALIIEQINNLFKSN